MTVAMAADSSKLIDCSLCSTSLMLVGGSNLEPTEWQMYGTGSSSESMGPGCCGRFCNILTSSFFNLHLEDKVILWAAGNVRIESIRDVMSHQLSWQGIILLERFMSHAGHRGFI